jgi:hypothetical protein
MVGNTEPGEIVERTPRSTSLAYADGATHVWIRWDDGSVTILSLRDAIRLIGQIVTALASKADPTIDD